jgi:hypothetical protein
MGVEVASQAVATLAAFPVVVTFPVVDFAQPRMRSAVPILVAEVLADQVGQSRRLGDRTTRSLEFAFLAGAKSTIIQQESRLCTS